MDSRKEPLLLPYAHISSSSTVGLILHLQYYQRCESMIFQMWMKSKFILWQPRCYDWMKKMIQKFMFLKYSFFENVLLVSVSRNSLQTPSFGKFYILTFNYFSEKEVLKYFWLTTVLVISKIKISTLVLKNPCISASHLKLGESVHTGCYI